MLFTRLICPAGNTFHPLRTGAVFHVWMYVCMYVCMYRHTYIHMIHTVRTGTFNWALSLSSSLTTQVNSDIPFIRLWAPPRIAGHILTEEAIFIVQVHIVFMYILLHIQTCHPPPSLPQNNLLKVCMYKTWPLFQTTNNFHQPATKSYSNTNFSCVFGWNDNLSCS